MRRVWSTEPERWRQLQLEVQQISRRIKKHVCRSLHEQQEREVQHIASLSGSQPSEYWEALHMLSGRVRQPTAVPDTAVDSAGIAHTGVDAVRQVWRDSWAQLAQHRPEDARFDAAFHQDISVAVQEQEYIEQEQVRPVPLTALQQQTAAALNCDITPAEVQASVTRLARGKAPGVDGVPSELLKHGGAAMLACLHQLCQSHPCPSRTSRTHLAGQAWSQHRLHHNCGYSFWPLTAQRHL